MKVTKGTKVFHLYVATLFQLLGLVNLLCRECHAEGRTVCIIPQLCSFGQLNLISVTVLCCGSIKRCIREGGLNPDVYAQFDKGID